jgi:hypothetical protein
MLRKVSRRFKHIEEFMLADCQLGFEPCPSRSLVRNFTTLHASWWAGYIHESVDGWMDGKIDVTEFVQALLAV